MKYTKRADGRYQVKVTVSKGKTKFFYGKTKKEIDHKILNYQEEKKLGRFFSEVASEWWEFFEEQLSYQTRSSYNAALKRIVEFFSDARIKDIKTKDINAFIFKLVEYDFAQKTISNHKIVCNKIFEYAVIQEEIEFNPCASVKLPKNLKKSKRSSASSEEEKIIFNSADVWLFPYIALLSGMRKGEILALQVKDVDFTEKTIKVSKSVYFEANKPKIKKPKTEAGNRIVPLLEPLEKKLLEYIRTYKLKKDDFIINDGKGNAITKKAFRYRYSKFQKETGIKCTPHQIRHSFATNAFESDVPVKAVQEILGHKQISTTMDIYTDFRKASFDSAQQKLNSNFEKKKKM